MTFHKLQRFSASISAVECGDGKEYAIVPIGPSFIIAAAVCTLVKCKVIIKPRFKYNFAQIIMFARAHFASCAAWMYCNII